MLGCFWFAVAGDLRWLCVNGRRLNLPLTRYDGALPRRAMVRRFLLRGAYRSDRGIC